MDRKQSKFDYLLMNSAEHERQAGASDQSMIAEDNGLIASGLTLMDKILSRENLNQAYIRVRDNLGAPGIDNVSVEDELLEQLKQDKDKMLWQIRHRKYKPDPVKRVYIPKDKPGEMRKLGIPTGKDRVIQQAIAQQLEIIYEPLFSDNSFGFRPHKGAHKALWRLQKYANEGYVYAICLDLEKFFDTVNHAKLIQLLSETIKEKDVISLIHKFLRAGVVDDGQFMKTLTGVPQGGPLSPILSNIFLTPLDRELEKRGLRYVRYADDVLVLCKSPRAAERVAKSITKYIEDKLLLKVNRDKTEITHIKNIKYLGYGFYIYKGQCKFKLHEKTVKKLKNQVREITKRNSGDSYETVKNKLNRYIKGWMAYYYLANCRGILQKLDMWIRHRLRQLFWKRWKRVKTRYRNLRRLGIRHVEALKLATSRKGYWRVSLSPQIHRALSINYLKKLGFIFLEETYLLTREKARKKIYKKLGYNCEN